jgi:ABC-type phosphate transport system substrate-binding protein
MKGPLLFCSRAEPRASGFSRRALAALSFVLCLGVLLSPSVVSRSTVLAQSEEGVVIVLNARNPTQALSASEASKIFLGQTAFWHGVVPVKVMLRPDGSLAAKMFYESVLKQTPQAFRKHWDELQLSGRGVAPKAYGGAEEMAAAIATAPGGIGFALSSEIWKVQNKGIKVVNIR